MGRRQIALTGYPPAAPVGSEAEIHDAIELTVLAPARNKPTGTGHPWWHIPEISATTGLKRVVQLVLCL